MVDLILLPCENCAPMGHFSTAGSHCARRQFSGHGQDGFFAFRIPYSNLDYRVWSWPKSRQFLFRIPDSSLVFSSPRQTSIPDSRFRIRSAVLLT